ncbi:MULTISPECIES: hypothetical protein [Methylobacterium]|uniref:Uncharacterized protein n=1 Tax=Methylobacterium isbiliense TaxID=315478 RepID=A0ABQ4SI14_9HYPH|nr:MULTISPECIES: hypothetical protein [Methylobacterium]MBY0298526.1 hypothetical protein [Methylobacterium sp.]MDN3627629.1 hypothetical protein [Methylobacterium isbiliense]GJE02209.1 hypothetical protein GMJLKIPL_4153 [Methylobacterium isbiliense]
MPKPTDYIGFRPGHLLGEISQRADAKGQARYVKTALANHFALLEAYYPPMRALFTPDECMYLFLALDGHEIEVDTLPVRVTAASRADGGLADVMAQLSVDTGALVEKLHGADAGVLHALADGLTKLRALVFDGERHFDGNGLPTRDSLRRCGLMRVPGPVAWGLCIVVCEDGRFIEYVLRRDVREMPQDEGDPIDPVGEAQALLAFTRDALGGRVSDTDARGQQIAYRIARHAGHRRFRVRARPGTAPEIAEVDPRHILADMHEQEMAPIWLAGVNAPDGARPR